MEETTPLTDAGAGPAAHGAPSLSVPANGSGPARRGSVLTRRMSVLPEHFRRSSFIPPVTTSATASPVPSPGLSATPSSSHLRPAGSAAKLSTTSLRSSGLLAPDSSASKLDPSSTNLLKPDKAGSHSRLGSTSQLGSGVSLASERYSVTSDHENIYGDTAENPNNNSFSFDIRNEEHSSISIWSLKFAHPDLEREFQERTEPRKRVIFRLGVWAYFFVNLVNLVYVDIWQHKGEPRLLALVIIRIYEQIGLGLLLILRVRTMWGRRQQRALTWAALTHLLVAYTAFTCIEMASAAHQMKDFYMIALIVWSVPFLSQMLYWDAFVLLWTLCPLQLMTLVLTEYNLSPDPHSWDVTKKYVTIIVIGLASLMSIYLREKDRRELFVLERLSVIANSDQSVLIRIVTSQLRSMSPHKKIFLLEHEILSAIKIQEDSNVLQNNFEERLALLGSSRTHLTELFLGPCAVVSIRPSAETKSRNFRDVLQSLYKYPSLIARICAKYKLFYCGSGHSFIIYKQQYFGSSTHLAAEDAQVMLQAAVEIVETLTPRYEVRVGLDVGPHQAWFDPRPKTHLSVQFLGKAVIRASRLAHIPIGEAQAANVRAAGTQIFSTREFYILYRKKSAIRQGPDILGASMGAPSAGATGGKHSAQPPLRVEFKNISLTDTVSCFAIAKLKSEQEAQRAEIMPSFTSEDLQEAAFILEWTGGLGRGQDIRELTQVKRKPMNDLDIRGISEEARDAARLAGMVWRAKAQKRPTELLVTLSDGSLSTMPVSPNLVFFDPALEHEYVKKVAKKSFTSVLVMSALFLLGWSSGISSDLHAEEPYTRQVLIMLRYCGIIPTLIGCMIMLKYLPYKLRVIMLQALTVFFLTLIAGFTVVMLIIAPAELSTSYGLYVLRSQMSIFSNYKIKFMNGLVASSFIFLSTVAQFYVFRPDHIKTGNGSTWLFMCNIYLILFGTVYSFFIEWTNRMLFYMDISLIRIVKSNEALEMFRRRLDAQEMSYITGPAHLTHNEHGQLMLSVDKPSVVIKNLVVIAVTLGNRASVTSANTPRRGLGGSNTNIGLSSKNLASGTLGDLSLSSSNLRAAASLDQSVVFEFAGIQFSAPDVPTRSLSKLPGVVPTFDLMGHSAGPTVDTQLDMGAQIEAIVDQTPGAFVNTVIGSTWIIVIPDDETLTMAAVGAVPSEDKLFTPLSPGTGSGTSEGYGGIPSTPKHSNQFEIAHVLTSKLRDIPRSFGFNLGISVDVGAATVTRVSNGVGPATKCKFLLGECVSRAIGLSHFANDDLHHTEDGLNDRLVVCSPDFFEAAAISKTLNGKVQFVKLETGKIAIRPIGPANADGMPDLERK